MQSYKFISLEIWSNWRKAYFPEMITTMGRNFRRGKLSGSLSSSYFLQELSRRERMRVDVWRFCSSSYVTSSQQSRRNPVLFNFLVNVFDDNKNDDDGNKKHTIQVQVRRRYKMWWHCIQVWWFLTSKSRQGCFLSS